jgi:hypothetical protein
MKTKVPTDKQMKTIQEEIRNRDRALWLLDHPGMTAKDYRRLEDTEAMREWRGARNEAYTAAVRQAWWERDHPSKPCAGAPPLTPLGGLNADARRRKTRLSGRALRPPRRSPQSMAAMRRGRW